MQKQGKILIVDDNEDILFALNLLLQSHVEKVKVTTKPERIEHFMQTFEPDVILLDMNFNKDADSGQEGFNWLEKIKKADPDMVVIFITAYADMEKAVQAIKAGRLTLFLNHGKGRNYWLQLLLLLNLDRVARRGCQS